MASGVSPRKATQLVGEPAQRPIGHPGGVWSTHARHLNYWLPRFEAVDGDHDADDLARFIMEAAYPPKI